MNLSQNNYKNIMNVDNMKNNNNIQFINCSNYSFIKNVINITIQINQRNIFINKIHDILYNNKLSFCKSSSNIYFEFYLFQYKNSQIYIIKSNYEYYDSFIEKKEIFIFISFIIILYLIIKEKYNKNKRNTIYFMKKWKNNIIYSIGKIGLFEIKIKSYKTLDLNAQKKLKDYDKKLVDITEKHWKINKIKNYIININFIIILIRSIILINLFYKATNNIFNCYFLQTSKILLKVKGIGEAQIFGYYFNDHIDSIYINSNRQNQISQQYSFNHSENLVEVNFNNNNLNSLNNMFQNCINIIEIDLSNFDISSVNDMDFMFVGCTSLTSINLKNFVTSSATSMQQMFAGCSSLKFLDLSYSIVSSVTNMRMIFTDCKSLTSINLTNFITSSVTDMSNMFAGCSSLKSLDLSYFITSSVNNMNFMFSECSSLTSINLTNFITSSVNDMSMMFSGCKSLTYLDLSYFDTSSVNNMQQMFKDCFNLEYINLYNFDESKITHMMWDNVPKNVVMCVKTISEDIIQTLKQDKHCLVIDCSKDWKSKQQKIINNDQCTVSCDKNSQ